MKCKYLYWMAMFVLLLYLMRAATTTADEIPFPSFDNEEGEPLIDRAQIWRWYDAYELMQFVTTYSLGFLLLGGTAVVLIELFRMDRERRNAASPYKLYAVPPRSPKKKE